MMRRPATRISVSGAKACTAAPSANSAPAISTVRLRPMLSASSPPASAPSKRAQRDPACDDLDEDRAQRECRFDARQRPRNHALVIAEQAAGKEDDDEHEGKRRRK